MSHQIRPGQVYVACHPLDEGRRIVVVTAPVTTPGLAGFGKVDVETIDGRGRRSRRRAMDITQLHASATNPRTGQPRRTGYALEEPKKHN